jgi:hypothetical protein
MATVAVHAGSKANGGAGGYDWRDGVLETAARAGIAGGAAGKEFSREANRGGKVGGGRCGRDLYAGGRHLEVDQPGVAEGF